LAFIEVLIARSSAARGATESSPRARVGVDLLNHEQTNDRTERRCRLAISWRDVFRLVRAALRPLH
jgi:hypothetical protein